MKILKYPNFTIPFGINYLSEVIDSLPKNCIYNKVVTGAGGTTIALTSNENYIVAVPFTELIHNKLQTHKNVLGVYKGVGTKAIKEYVNDYKIPVKKIMVTYDSLPRLIQSIETKDFNLLVDEYQLLFQQYTFRNKAISGILLNYTKFKSYCFMTASLMEEEFVLKEFKHLPVYETDWENIKEVTIESCECKSNVIHTVCFLVENFLKDKTKDEFSPNAHIFVNSLEFIKQVIKNCNLKEDDVKIVWSKNNEAKMPYNRGTTFDYPKTINFYTSSCYVGCDIHDINGKIFVVSDHAKPQTLVDIYSEIKQICGRIRDTKYWNTITHIYTTKKYDNTLTFEDYKKIVEQEIKIAYDNLKEVKEISSNFKNSLIQTIKKSTDKKFGNYISINNDTLYFDENLVNYDLYNFKLSKCTYKIKVNLHQEYELAGYKITEFIPTEQITKVKPINKKDNLIENIKEFEKGDSNFALWMYKNYDWFHDAITYVGLDKIKELNYSITNIKYHISQKKITVPEELIKSKVHNNHLLTEGAFYSLEYLKETLSNIYKELNLNKKAKAVDLLPYWNIKTSCKKYKGKTINGYILISKK